MPVSGEAGPEAPYGFSLARARDRWAEGFSNGRQAVAQVARGEVAAGATLAIRRSKPPAGADAERCPTTLAA